MYKERARDHCFQIWHPARAQKTDFAGKWKKGLFANNLR